MGQALLACAARQPALQVTGQADLGDDLEKVAAGCDVMIDFSAPSATVEVARCCARHGRGLVIGTTGHSQGQHQEILEVIKEIPVVWASNYSTGVNVLFWLTRRAAETLGPDFDLEVVEMHHRHK